ncbi:MAG: imidazole glycerol phosphate synthase subunit HisH [Nitrospirae bacterium]|nr:imidazole glycerol phosphate synthase subunit HisH [Nitrospirota bacterium]
MIAIVDYGMGNLRSVEKGFLKAGVDAVVTNSPGGIEKADGVVLPGVGAFGDCMKELANLKLTDAIAVAIKKGKPYLGICLGLQVLFSESEEFGRCRGLDIFKGKAVKFQPSAFNLQPSILKVPHMGWNQIKIQKNNPLLNGIPDRTYYYFVHSYYVVPEDGSVVSATTDYGIDFTSMIWKDNIFAVQFHPEKSQAMGLKLLENFGKLVAKRP